MPGPGGTAVPSQTGWHQDHLELQPGCAFLTGFLGTSLAVLWLLAFEPHGSKGTRSAKA